MALRDLAFVVAGVVSGAEGMVHPRSRALLVDDSPAVKIKKDARILLVEDYPANQMVAMRHLGDEGYHVEVAENGMQAVQAFGRSTYDLVFMDIQMPVMDGFEATRRIRSIEAERDGAGRTPIVAMTAHAMIGFREKCLEEGMDDFLSKPLKKQGLLAVVERWVARAKAADDEAAQEPEEVGDAEGPMDLAQLVEEFEGDREFAGELLEKFMEVALTQPATIRSAIEDGDAEVVRTQAHSIKGGAANLFAKALSEVAKDLEYAGRDKDLVKASALLELLEVELGRLEAFYRDEFPQQ
jgi:CheY-like chemotaxis protein/HPt (histidine-containing phosphotransfer) domain-containing protein